MVVITETVLPTNLIPGASSSPSSTASSSSSSSSSGLSSGAIAGIAVGAFAGVAVLAAAGFLFLKREKRDMPPPVAPPTYPAPHDDGYPPEIKPPGSEEPPRTGIRYLDPDAPNATVGEIPSGRLQQ